MYFQDGFITMINFKSELIHLHGSTSIEYFPVHVLDLARCLLSLMSGSAAGNTLRSLQRFRHWHLEDE